MALPDRIAELDRQIAAAVERAVSEVRSELQARLERATSDLRATLSAELTPPRLPQSFLAAADLEPLTQAAAAEAAQAAAAEAAQAAAAQAARASAAAAQAARASALDALRDTLAELDRATGQRAVLETLLDGARRYASRAGIFLLTPDGVRGWQGSGFGDEARFTRLAVEWDAAEAWGELRQGKGAVELTAADCARLLAEVDDAMALGGALVPLVLRDRVAAALYADRLDEQAPWSLAALQTLTWSAGLALETLPFRQRAASPTLRSLADAAAAAGLAIWDPQEVVEEPALAPAAVAPPAAAVETAASVAEPAPAPPMPAGAAGTLGGGWPGTAWAAEPEPAAIEPTFELPEPSLEEPVFEIAPEPELAVPEPAAPYVEAAAPAVEEAPEVVETPADAGWTYDEAPAETAAVERSTYAPPEPPRDEAFAMPEPPELPSIAPPPPASPLDMSEDATYLLSRGARSAPAPSSSTQEVPSLDEDITHPGVAPPSEPRPVLAPEPPRAAAETTAPVPQQKPGWQSGGSTEVAPPPDLQGPGWAFATTRIPTVQATPAAAPSEDSTHDEARRLARLLVSEIKLYNEEQVEDGRRNRDIYERLKEDIDRSRQMYEERVDERVRNTTDYFYQELVRILAGGDPKAMGI